MDNLNSHTLGCEKPLSAGVHNYLCYGWVGGFQKYNDFKSSDKIKTYKLLCTSTRHRPPSHVFLIDFGLKSGDTF